MSSPVVRLTIRGVLARKFRVLLTAFAIVLGVAFVSGAFMLTDSPFPTRSLPTSPRSKVFEPSR
jgi:hypothetical protein